MLERSLRMISFTARKREESVLGKWCLIANLQVNSRGANNHTFLMGYILSVTLGCHRTPSPGQESTPGSSLSL